MQTLKPACSNALKRIFKLCDANKDGLVDTKELNDFQVRVVGQLLGFQLILAVEMLQDAITAYGDRRHP